MEPYRATLQVQRDATPRFFKPRSVPFAIRDAVGKELDRLEQQGIIEKVSHSEWAAPIVPVPKKDGRFRICGDYKVTANQVLSVEQYPLPKPEDLFATLAGGQAFSKLDLSQAYLYRSNWMNHQDPTSPSTPIRGCTSIRDFLLV